MPDHNARLRAHRCRSLLDRLPVFDWEREARNAGADPDLAREIADTMRAQTPDIAARLRRSVLMYEGR